MASMDLLGKLFDAEREAEALVAAAREEAGRRRDLAKARARQRYGEAYEDAMAKAIAIKARSEEAAKAEYEAAITDFRERLESSRVDLATFNAACEAALEEGL
jgi:vacuolar-type H+-ATPase subunit H